MSVSEELFVKKVTELISGFSITFGLLSEALIEKGFLDRDHLIDLLNGTSESISKKSDDGLDSHILKIALSTLIEGKSRIPKPDRPTWFQGVIDGSRHSPDEPPSEQ